MNYGWTGQDAANTTSEVGDLGPDLGQTPSVEVGGRTRTRSDADDVGIKTSSTRMRRRSCKATAFSRLSTRPDDPVWFIGISTGPVD